MIFNAAADYSVRDFASRLSSPAAFFGWAMYALLVCLCCLRFSLRHFGYLFAGARAKCLQLIQWQVIRDETHRAIGKGEGGTARMITAEGGKAKHFPARIAGIGERRYTVIDRHGSAEKIFCARTGPGARPYRSPPACGLKPGSKAAQRRSYSRSSCERSPKRKVLLVPSVISARRTRLDWKNTPSSEGAGKRLNVNGSVPPLPP